MGAPAPKRQGVVEQPRALLPPSLVDNATSRGGGDGSGYDEYDEYDGKTSRDPSPVRRDWAYGLTRWELSEELEWRGLNICERRSDVHVLLDDMRRSSKARYFGEARSTAPECPCDRCSRRSSNGGSGITGGRGRGGGGKGRGGGGYGGGW
jgi:hypothetical protein